MGKPDSRGLRPGCYPGCPEWLPGPHVEAWTGLHPQYHQADARGGGWWGPLRSTCHSRRPPLPPTIRGPLGDCFGEQVRVPGASPKQGVPSRCSGSRPLHLRAAPTVRRVFLPATAPEHVSLAGRSRISRNSLSAMLLDRVAPGKILGRLGRSAGQQCRHPSFLTADSSRGHEATAPSAMGRCACPSPRWRARDNLVTRFGAWFQPKLLLVGSGLLVAPFPS